MQEFLVQERQLQTTQERLIAFGFAGADGGEVSVQKVIQEYHTIRGFSKSSADAQRDTLGRLSEQIARAPKNVDDAQKEYHLSVEALRNFLSALQDFGLYSASSLLRSSINLTNVVEVAVEPLIRLDKSDPSEPEVFLVPDVSRCSIPDDHISPRRSALFMARSVLRELRDGEPPC